MQAPARWEVIAKKYPNMEGALQSFNMTTGYIDSHIVKPHSKDLVAIT